MACASYWWMNSKRGRAFVQFEFLLLQTFPIYSQLNPGAVMLPFCNKSFLTFFILTPYDLSREWLPATVRIRSGHLLSTQNMKTHSWPGFLRIPALLLLARLDVLSLFFQWLFFSAGAQSTTLSREPGEHRGSWTPSSQNPRHPKSVWLQFCLKTAGSLWA